MFCIQVEDISTKVSCLKDRCRRRQRDEGVGGKGEKETKKGERKENQVKEGTKTGSRDAWAYDA